jgi:hypothetical protein
MRFNKLQYHLSSEGIVHGDLAARFHPYHKRYLDFRNILLTRDLIPKIADCGMSRILLNNLGGSVTQSNMGSFKIFFGFL